MILKASQRGGARQLAAHLMNTDENDHVEIHEIRGFISNSVHGALQEIHAISRGTRCRQFLFSLSLNPPQTENAPIEYFENALNKIEKEMKLEGQPRVIVFHEKEGRRHAHCVWSRIKIDEMKAIGLPFFKWKLQKISKQLYFQYGWEVPKGLLNRKDRDPLNYSLPEYQQAKRHNNDPKALKAFFQDCWARSDNAQSFTHALKEQGFKLAKGNRRGFVAVDHSGEIYSLSRWIGVKTKELKNRLGDPEDYPAVEDIKTEFSNQTSVQPKMFLQQTEAQNSKEYQRYLKQKQALKKQHQEQRQRLRRNQEIRRQRETLERAHRLPTGLKAIWLRITGQYQKTRKEMELQVKVCRKWGRDELHAQIIR